MSLNVGMKFRSFASLQEAIRELEAETNTIFIRQDCNKTKMLALAETMVYDRIMFACKQGRERKPQGKGERKQQRSVKLGCSAKVRAMLKYVDEEWALVVTIVNVHHDTHTPSKEALSIFPETRKIVETATTNILVNCPSISAKEFLRTVEAEQGKRLLPKDIHNFRARARAASGVGSSDAAQVQASINQVKDNGGLVDFAMDSAGSLCYLSIMTRTMKDVLQSFPEVLVMDVTYKTNKYLLPLLTIMCIDNNGKGHPVFHSFLSTEDQGVLVKALEFFKQSFDSSKTSCFFVDKDFSEIGALSIVFPGKTPIVCAFHIATAVKKALCNKGLSAQQAETIRSLFMDMKDALTEEEYNQIRSKLEEVCPEHIVHYFQANWFDKANLWAAHRLVGVGKLHVTTTNHCESYHQKIKQLLSTSSSLSKCLDNLLQFDLDLFYSSSFQNRRNFFTKPLTYDGDQVIDLINLDLTPFAANLVIEQYRLIVKFSYAVHAVSDDTYTLVYDNHAHTVSVSSCSCQFYINFDLPCRHIFYLRRHLSMDVYQPLSADHRFKPHLFDSNAARSHAGQISSSLCPSRRLIRTPEDKYKAAEVLSKRICTYMSLLGDREFEDKYLQLSTLFETWSGATNSIPETQTESEGNDVGHVSAGPMAASSSRGISPTLPDSLISDFAIIPSVPTGSGPTTSSPVSELEGNDVDHVSTGPMAASSSHGISPTLPDSLNSDFAIIPSVPTGSGPTTPSPNVSELEGNDVDHVSTGPMAASSSRGISPTLPDSLNSDFAIIPSVPTGSGPTTSAPNVSELEGNDDHVSTGPAAITVPSTRPTVAPSFDEAVAFSQVVLQPVRVKGRPRNRQTFTRRKRKAHSLKTFAELPPTKQVSMFVQGAVRQVNDDSSAVYSANDIRDVVQLSPLLVCHDFSMIEPCFDSVAWSTLLSRVEQKRVENLYQCASCDILDDGELKMIQCECCCNWFHFSCVGYRSHYNVKKWFCSHCF